MHINKIIKKEIKKENQTTITLCTPNKFFEEMHKLPYTTKLLVQATTLRTQQEWLKANENYFWNQMLTTEKLNGNKCNVLAQLPLHEATMLAQRYTNPFLEPTVYGVAVQKETTKTHKQLFVGKIMPEQENLPTWTFFAKYNIQKV